MKLSSIINNSLTFLVSLIVAAASLKDILAAIAQVLIIIKVSYELYNLFYKKKKTQKGDQAE